MVRGAFGIIESVAGLEAPELGDREVHRVRASVRRAVPIPGRRTGDVRNHLRELFGNEAVHRGGTGQADITLEQPGHPLPQLTPRARRNVPHAVHLAMTGRMTSEG